MRQTLSEAAAQIKLGSKVIALVFKSSPRWASFYFLANTANSITPTITLLVGKLTVDAVIASIKNPSPENIRLIILYTLLAFLAEGTNSFFGSLAMHGFDVMKDIFTKYFQGTVLEEAAELDLSYFEDPKFHDRLEKVRRELSYRPMNVMSETAEALSSFIGLLSLSLILFRLAPWAPVVLLVFSLPRLVFRLKFSYWTYTITDDRTPYSRRVYQINWVMTSKDAAKEIKAFGLKHYFLKIFDDLNDRFFKENRALSQKQNTYSFFLDLLGSVVYYGLSLFTAFQAIASRLTIGDLTMITGTIRQYQNVLQGIFAYTARFYEHNLFLNHYFALMELKPKITTPPDPKRITDTGPLKIEFRNVCFNYENGKAALKNINLTISDAKNFALVGENGAGKTTLVKLILRLYEVTSGQILINGTDIKQIDLDNLRDQIGVIFQDFRAYDLTVRENIGVGDIKNINNIGRIRKAARLSGASEFIEQFPEKYKTMLGKNWEKGEELSGGQWQKIALARAFFKDAKILIMDEPTSALDPKSEYEVFRNLISHTAHKSLILISHRFSTVRLADEIIVLHKGETIEQGTHESLMEQNGHYAKLYNLQAKWYK